MEAKTIVCSIAIDAHLTFQEFDVFQEHLGAVLHAISSDNIKISARTNDRRTLIGFSKLASQEDVAVATKKIVDGFFADQSASGPVASDTKESATEALFKTLADSLVAVSERYYQPLAILFTSGRRRIDRKLRNILVRLARGSAPLIIFRLANEYSESCCDDDGLIWACSQTPNGLFCRLGVDRIPGLEDIWKPGYQDDTVHAPNDHKLIKLIEYELPRYSMHHLDSILDARQREGFRVQRRDLSPKRYLDEPRELSARLLWSPRLVLEYVICMDGSTRRLKAQFCLRGQESLLKTMESNHDLVEFVRECIEVDVVISHLCGPSADAAFQHLLSTQSGQQLARFVKTASMEAICGVSAESEINALFPRNHEWIIPKTLVLLTSSWHELERTASKVHDSRKLLLVSPHRMSLAGLFHSNGASVDRATKVLRHPESVPTEEACQDSLSTLALLWRRKGFFQTSPVDGVAIDFVLLPESDAEPAVRLTASASPATGVTATVTVQGDCTSMDRYIRLLEEDEQVLVRLQTFADLHSPRELLPFARRSIPLELPTFSSVSKEECDRALAAALIEVFTIKVEKDQCHARYVSKDAVVILCETDGVQTLFDIRRADLLPLPPSSVTSGGNPPPALFHAGSLGSVNPEEEAAHLMQFVTRLRSGFSRCVAAIVHSDQSIMLRTEDDVRLVEEGCEATYIDVDISKLTILDALQDDFAEQLSRVVTLTCGLPPTDETQGFFRAHDGFIRMAVRQENKDEMRLNLKNSISILREALFHPKSASPTNLPGGPVTSYSKSMVKEERRAWLRIYFLSPFPFPGAVPHSHARTSTLSVSSVREGRTIASIEKEIGILVSTTILQFARRILVTKPDLAIRLVRDILASVSESIRLDIPLLPFVHSTSFEQDEDKLDFLAKELAGQTDFPLRLISQHSPHGLMLIHSDEECWALLTITLTSVHVDMWSFADPASKKASARVSECVMRIQRRTNQLLLLSDLHETRMASSQLVPVTSSDYPFFACPSQRHLDISLGRWVTRQRMLKELGSSPVFFVRNRERWFVYRALNHKIAYFTVVKNEENEENGGKDSSAIFSIELFAIDSLNQNAVDHLQKLLKEMVVELAVESLASYIQHKQQQQHQLGTKAQLPNLFLSQKEWDLDLLISQDASTNKHSHDFPCNATNLSRHLTTAIKKRLLVVIGEDSVGVRRVPTETSPQTTTTAAAGNNGSNNKVTLLCLVEEILLIVSFEEQIKPRPAPENSASNVVKTEIWIPTRRGNSSKAVRAFLDGFADALTAAERAAHFEQRLLAEQDSITDFEALVAAAREACGSNTVDLFQIFEKSTMEMRGDESGVAAAAEMMSGDAPNRADSSRSMSDGVLPNWSTLYLLRDVERRATQDLKFEKTHAFRSWLRRSPGMPPTWSLLQQDDEERILQAGEDGMISATKLEEADSSAKRRGPFVLESLAVVIANKPFWLKQRSASMSAHSPHKPPSKRLANNEETSVSTPSSGMRKSSVQSLTGLLRDEAANLTMDDGLKILLVLATPSSVETVGFAVDEAQLTLVQESIVASATWLIGRLQALANPAVRMLAGFGKRRQNWTPSTTCETSLERSSRRTSVGSVSPRVSNLESTGRQLKKQDSTADPAQEVARWTQERRSASGSNVGLRALPDVIRVFRSCRPLMSFRVPALCSFPDPEMMSPKELLRGSSSVLEFELNMTLVCESERFRYYFCILGGTHLLMTKLYTYAGGGVGVEAQVRELGKHNGGTTLCLALANVHETLPKIRAAVHDTFVGRIAKMVLIERHPLGPQTAIDIGRVVRSEGWEGAKGIDSDQIACEVFNVLDIEFEEWTKALFERVSGPSNFVLGNALVHRDASFDCILLISKVSSSPIVPRCAFVYAELCVIAQKRTDLHRAVGLATPWAKHRVEMCAADVRWRSFWRMVRRSNARSEIQSLVLEEDMIGEEARVSLTLIDPRFDDLLGCIEHGIAWLGPLQRALTQAGWLVVTVKQHANASPNGLLLSREDCADRFAVFAAIEETSTVFDLMSRVESDVRSFPPELQSMLSWLLRVLGAIFLDACVARVDSIFDLVGLESAFITDLADSDTEVDEDEEEQQSHASRT